MPRAVRLGLAAAVLLFGFEALMLALGLFFPRVSPGYRAFYIARSTDCWVPPAQRVRAAARDLPERIRPADLPLPARCAVLPYGWSSPEPWGIWTQRATARLTVPLRPGDTGVDLVLQGFAPPGGAQSVEITADGVPAQRLDLPRDATRTVHIARHGPAPLLDVTLHVAHPLSPLALGEGADDRRLGVRLVEIVRR
jgi:hypothetical protein